MRTTVLKSPASLTTTQRDMDLNFTEAELAFRAEVRDWVRANLPSDIAHKVRHALRLNKDDL